MSDDVDYEIECFVWGMGEPWLHVPASEEALAQLSERVAPEWVQVWERLGFSGFVGGRFWLTNPLDFEGVVEQWVAGTPMEGLDDYVVFGRGPFGDLTVLGVNSHRTFSIDCSMNFMAAAPVDQTLRGHDPFRRLRSTLMVIGGKPDSLSDLADASGVPLFDRVVEKLGPLAAGEVYLFEPSSAIMAPSVERAAKGRLDAYLSIQYELGGVKFMNIN